MARVSPLVLIPPAIFAGIAAMFFWGMGRDNPDDLPSTFIGRQAPALATATVGELATPTDADLRTGTLTLVNFWATWCPPCRAEHPTLKRLAGEGVRIIGVNIRDDAAKAEAYLAEEGDPFIAVAGDPTGRTGFLPGAILTVRSATEIVLSPVTALAGGAN